MDLLFTADELAFRDELRAFFRDNLPEISEVDPDRETVGAAC